MGKRRGALSTAESHPHSVLPPHPTRRFPHPPHTHTTMDHSSFSGAPRFLTRPKAFVVSVGKDATLSCQIVGNPTPQVSWEKDLQQVEAGTRFRLAHDGDLYRLTILDLALGDSGQYVCRARNAIGEAFAAVGLQVDAEAACAEQAPHFLLRPTSIRVREGAEATFRCRVRGSPPMSVSWAKDGRRLGALDAPRVRVEASGEASALRILAARPRDSGTYTVHAENPLGAASAAAGLSVDKETDTDCPPGASTAMLLAHLQLRREAMRTEGAPASPRSACTRTCTVTEGKHARLSCFVTGEPKPEIVWKKDGQLVAEGRRHVVYEDAQENFVLKILFCKQSDCGLYTCTASNLVGQTYSSVLVVVRGELLAPGTRSLCAVSTGRGSSPGLLSFPSSVGCCCHLPTLCLSGRGIRGWRSWQLSLFCSIVCVRGTRVYNKVLCH